LSILDDASLNNLLETAFIVVKNQDNNMTDFLLKLFDMYSFLFQRLQVSDEDYVWVNIRNTDKPRFAFEIDGFVQAFDDANMIPSIILERYNDQREQQKQILINSPYRFYGIMTFDEFKIKYPRPVQLSQTGQLNVKIARYDDGMRCGIGDFSKVSLLKEMLVHLLYTKLLLNDTTKTYPLEQYYVSVINEFGMYINTNNQMYIEVINTINRMLSRMNWTELDDIIVNQAKEQYFKEFSVDQLIMKINQFILANKNNDMMIKEIKNLTLSSNPKAVVFNSFMVDYYQDKPEDLARYINNKPFVSAYVWNELSSEQKQQKILSIKRRLLVLPTLQSNNQLAINDVQFLTTDWNYIPFIILYHMFLVDSKKLAKDTKLLSFERPKQLTKLPKDFLCDELKKWFLINNMYMYSMIQKSSDEQEQELVVEEKEVVKVKKTPTTKSSKKK
jgi:hypothetical protein